MGTSHDLSLQRKKMKKNLKCYGICLVSACRNLKCRQEETEDILNEINKELVA